MDYFLGAVQLIERYRVVFAMFDVRNIKKNSKKGTGLE